MPTYQQVPALPPACTCPHPLRTRPRPLSQLLPWPLQVSSGRLGPLGRLRSTVAAGVQELRSAPKLKDLLEFEARGCGGGGGAGWRTCRVAARPGCSALHGAAGEAGKASLACIQSSQAAPAPPHPMLHPAAPRAAMRRPPSRPATATEPLVPYPPLHTHLQAPRVLVGRGLEVVGSDEEWGRQSVAGMNPCTLAALKQMPAQLGSAIAAEHVDSECRRWLVRAARGRAHPHLVLLAGGPARLHAGQREPRQQREPAPHTASPAHRPPPAEEIAELGGTSLAQHVADAAAGGKPRLFLIDYWLMAAFWEEAPKDLPGRAEHAGRALLFLQQ